MEHNLERQTPKIALSEFPGKKDFIRELRVNFAIFAKRINSE